MIETTVQKWLNKDKNSQYDPDADIPALPAMGPAFIFALLDKVSGRVVFYLAFHHSRHTRCYSTVVCTTTDTFSSFSALG